MRTYQILSEAGHVVRTDEVEDSMRPSLLAGESLRLTHVDGEPAIKGEPLKISDAERAALPLLPPAAPDAAVEVVHRDPVPESDVQHAS